ncbi:tail fiber domain-containing protein [Mariniflexile litorale]|uniref:Tail fiber domain-containing protein n=1 Tax=Mariniflexile litorale TaxID=3045158 RepID=A0AAU7EGL9_9FLAO|nr:tail fiber domain-containing protein [Mariniflexile sp. KMM 9835]MDQ8211569.1 tail fiber domain-containing protein [Mariniflexile sp. KMM 9835]
MKKTLLFALLCTYGINAQVGIGTTTPKASSVLDITSTNKGVLVPRISLSSTSDNTTIASPTTSLLIYNNATVLDVTPGYYYWGGSKWLRLITESKDAWNILGNSGTNSAVNFIGTTDNQDLVFKRNNVLAGKITNSNTSFGISTLSSNTSGYSNTAIGSTSLSANTSGYSNTAIGGSSLSSNTVGRGNTAVGNHSLNANETGILNTAIGEYSLLLNTSGGRNTAVGKSSLHNNSIGADNTAIGYQSLQGNTTGGFNTAMGENSLQLNTTGTHNTAVGTEALSANTTGTHNTAIGYLSLKSNTTGQQNIAIGYNASSTTTGHNNIVIGSWAQVPTATASNQVRIGNEYIFYAGVQVAWSVTSDARLKNTIENSNLGLDFINKLRPVSYYRNNNETDKLEYGFIAQELREALKNSGIKNSSIITVDDEGMLSVRYNDLMSPMVKAIQEQTEEIKVLKSENEALKLKQLAIEKELEEIKKLLLK